MGWQHRAGTYLRVAVLAGVCIVAWTGCSERRSRQSVQEGDTYFGLHNYAEASAAYRKALEADPENAAAHRGLARVLARQDKIDEALEAYGKAIETDPEYRAAYVEMARLQMSHGRIEGAEETARKLQAVHAEGGDLLLANLYLDSGRVPEAVELLETRRDQDPESAAVAVALSQAYVAAGRLPDAETTLKGVLEGQADDAESAVPLRMALIDVYRAQGKAAAMVDELKTLAKERPDDLDLKLVLARSLLEIDRYDDAESLAAPVLARRPDSGWANFIVGSCLLARQQFADAIPYLETAARAMPNQPVVEQKLALARSGESQDRGTETAEAGEDSAPGTSAPARARLGDGWEDLWRSGQLVRLVEERRRVLDDAGPAEEAREALVLAALATGRQEALDEVLPRLADGSPLAVYARALASKDFKGAIQALEPWKGTAEKQVLYLNGVGLAAALAGARGQALLILAKVTGEHPENAAGLHILADVYRAARMPEFAERVLQKMLERYPENIEARQMLFQVYMNNDKLTEARAAAESSYLLFPDRRETILSLVHVYMRSGQMALAQQVLDNGLKALPNEPMLHLAQAELRLCQGRAAEAREALARAGETPEIDTLRRPVLAMSLAQENDWAGLAKLTDRLDPDSMNVPTLFLRLAALVQEGRTEEAAALLREDAIRARLDRRGTIVQQALGIPAPGIEPSDERVAARLASDPEALTLYAYGMACREAGLPEAALEAFKKTAERVGDHPILVALQLGALAASPSIEDKQAVGREYVEKHPDMAEAWLGLAELRRRAEDVSGAVEALDRARELDPDSREVWLQRASFAEKQQNEDMAIEAYRRLIDLMPNSPAFQNNYAYHLLQRQGDLDTALEAAQAAAQGLPRNPSVLHTLGLAQLRKNDVQSAHDNLRMAVEMRPGDPTLLLDYGQALIALDRVEEGRQKVDLALQLADVFGLDFPRRAEAEKILAAVPAESAPGSTA